MARPVFIDNIQIRLRSLTMASNKPRTARFNSFELSDTEHLSQSNLKSMVLDLQTFFPGQSKEFEEIDKVVEDYKMQNADEEDFPEIPLYKNEKFVMNARKDMKCLEALKNIRAYMAEDRKNIEVTNWDHLVKDGFKVQCYQTFIYTLMRLIDIDAGDKVNRELAFNAGRTYMTLLGLPGAKRCLIWEADLVILYFKLFSFHRNFKSPGKSSHYDENYLEIQIIQMLSECNRVFNIVCLTDQEEVLEKYIETISSTLESFLENGKQSSHEIIMKCYENLEALCLKPLPEKEIEGIMYLIFCRTVDLHFISQKRGHRQSSKAKHGESISDFFLHLLSTYSDKTKHVLIKFIKSLLSNLEHKFERDKFQKLLEVAVKYELAIYWVSGDSLLDYLDKLVLAADHRHRLNGVEFCGKMLLINSTPDPGQQPMRIDVPRETLILKILFERIYDKLDNVKLKTLTALKAAIINGNEYCKKIFSVIFKPNSTSDNPEILEALGEDAKTFETNLLSLLQTSPSTYIRKTCLEILGLILTFAWKF